MKYKKLILLLTVIVVLFVGGGLLYSTLSRSMNNAGAPLSGRESTDNTVTSTIAITASTEVTASETTGTTSDEESVTAATSGEDSTAATFAGASTAADASAPAKGLAVGNLAYDFTLTNSEGNDVKLSDYRGKVVILNFWASWCGPCREEMPDFQKIQDDITAAGDKADTVILAVNMTDGQYETKDTASKYMQDQGYTYPLLFDDGSVSTLYQIYYIPETFILDKDGTIIKVMEGSTNLETLNAAVEEARG
jgi:peroxiredoxin